MRDTEGACCVTTSKNETNIGMAVVGDGIPASAFGVI